MALLANYRSPVGLEMSYHRIWQLDIETNVMVGVHVRSYVSESERQRELNGETAYHVDTCYFADDYESAPITIGEAYDWLKATHTEFAEAEDC